MKKNIVLIGMPGSGKSTVGKALAEKIGYEYMDSDEVIVARTGMELNALMASVGLEGFLDIEGKVNSELCVSRCVIATGGSAVYRERAMQKLKETGHIVYLQLPYETIESRLGDLKARGVAIKEGYTLKDLFNERVPLYEKYAEITVALGGKTLSESVNAVVEALKE